MNLQLKDLAVVAMCGDNVKVYNPDPESLYFSVDGLLSSVFGDGKYHHQSKPQWDETQILYTEGSSKERFFSVDVLAAYFAEHRVRESSYRNNPQKYGCYVQFLKDGGINHVIQEALKIDTINYLGQTNYVQALPDIYADQEEEQQVSNVELELITEQVDQLTIEIEGLGAVVEEELSSKAKVQIQVDNLEVGLSQLESELEKVASITELPSQETLELIEKSEGLAKDIVQLQFNLEDVKDVALELYESKKDQDSRLSKLSAANKVLAGQLNSMSDRVQELEESLEQKAQAPSSIQEFLKSSNIFLWGTMFLILCLLPFTFSALVRYVGFHTEGTGASIATYAMCAGISLAWDFSILIFTINGKQQLSKTGSFFQLIFFGTHFDLIRRYFDFFFGSGGDVAQEMLVTTCIVVFGAILINQFSELANKNND